MTVRKNIALSPAVIVGAIIFLALIPIVGGWLTMLAAGIVGLHLGFWSSVGLFVLLRVIFGGTVSVKG